jgi:hypothetical protein
VTDYELKRLIDMHCYKHMLLERVVGKFIKAQ